MIRKMCLAGLLFFLTLPVYAGTATIQETDTGIIVEYIPDDSDKLATKTQKEAQEKEEELKIKADQIRKDRSENKAALREERRKEEE